MDKNFYIENGFVRLSEIGYKLGLDRGHTTFLKDNGYINVITLNRVQYVQDKEIKQFTRDKVNKMRNKPGYGYDSDMNDLFNIADFQDEKAVAFCEMVKLNKSVEEIMEELMIPMKHMWLAIKKVKYLRSC